MAENRNIYGGKRGCSDEYPDELFKILDAINDPIRLRILSYLKNVDSARFSDILRCVGITKNLLSYHIKKLRRAGLITQEATEEKGKIKFFYSITLLGENVINTVPFLLVPKSYFLKKERSKEIISHIERVVSHHIYSKGIVKVSSK